MWVRGSVRYRDGREEGRKKGKEEEGKKKGRREEVEEVEEEGRGTYDASVRVVGKATGQYCQC